MKLKDQVFELRTEVPDKELFIAVNDIGANVPLSELFFGEVDVNEEYVRGYSYLGNKYPDGKSPLIDGYVVDAEGRKICFYSESLKSLILIKKIRNPIVMFMDRESNEEYFQRFKKVIFDITEKTRQPEEVKAPEGVTEGVDITPEGTESTFEENPVAVEDAVEQGSVEVIEEPVELTDYLLEHSRPLYLQLKKILANPSYEMKVGEIGGHKYALYYIKDNLKDSILVVYDSDGRTASNIHPIVLEGQFSVFFKGKNYTISTDPKNPPVELETETENPSEESQEKAEEDLLKGE